MLLREINRTSGGVRFRRQVEPKPYIAAFFKELPTEFTLGDNKIYGDFENKQLLNGHEYIFFVLAVLEISENDIVKVVSPQHMGGTTDLRLL
ncbi:receptor-type tyrosine-protein phosphatase delta isoform X1 [Tachysurus ichikawai]